jgi:hypothetical protein
MRSISARSKWYPNRLRVFYGHQHSRSVKTKLLCPSKPKEEPSRKHTKSYNRVRAILIFFETVEPTLRRDAPSVDERHYEEWKERGNPAQHARVTGTIGNYLCFCLKLTTQATSSRDVHPAVSFCLYRKHQQFGTRIGKMHWKLPRSVAICRMLL